MTCGHEPVCPVSSPINMWFGTPYVLQVNRGVATPGKNIRPNWDYICVHKKGFHTFNNCVFYYHFSQALAEFQRMRRVNIENDAFYCIMILMTVVKPEIVNIEVACPKRLRAAHAHCFSYLSYKVRE